MLVFVDPTESIIHMKSGKPSMTLDQMTHIMRIVEQEVQRTGVKSYEKCMMCASTIEVRLTDSSENDKLNQLPKVLYGFNIQVENK